MQQPERDAHRGRRADSNGLTFDAPNSQYTWDWKTLGSWKGTCRALIVRFADNTEKKLLFRF